MKIIKNITLFILVLLINSCEESNTETKPLGLLDRVWELKAIETNGLQEIPPEGQLYNIKFKSDQKFSGLNDCNEIFGDYSLNSNKISINRIVSTEMYCGKESLDHRFLSALESAESFKISNEELSIFYNSDSRLIFSSE